MLRFSFYQFFPPNWFFGYIGRIDRSEKLYGILYQDGDKEELLEKDVTDILVRTDNGIVVTTSQKPEEVSAEEWKKEVMLNDSAQETFSILSDEMYSHLDRDFLRRFLRNKEGESGRRKSRRRTTSVSPQRPKNRRRQSATSLSPKPSKRTRIPPPAFRRTSYMPITKSFFDKTGKINQQVCEFFKFMHERQSMWVRINGNNLLPGAPGSGREYVTTHDEVLSTYSFCNVYRELDRGTAYFHAHILKLREGKKEWTDLEWLEQVLWAALVYRPLNKIETFSEIGVPTIEEADAFVERAETYKQSGRTFFTSAHQTGPFQNYLQHVKSLSQENRIHDKAVELIEARDTMHCINILKSIQSIGSFFAWQIYCDLRESGCLVQHRDDQFCCLGPGAISKFFLYGKGSSMRF